MTLRFIIISLTIIVLSVISLTVVGQSITQNRVDGNQSGKYKNLYLDTSNTVFIKSKFPFDSTYKEATITQNELQTVDSLLKICVADYNNSLDQNHKEYSIGLSKHNYKKQLIVVINQKGEKVIWINCFCRSSNDRWKTKIELVDDGGNCYFNFKINLTTNKYYDLAVNGEA